MLKTFRSKLTSWLMLGVLGLAVLALVFGDLGGSMSGAGSSGTGSNPGDTLVEIGKEKVTSAELDETIRRRLRDAQQQNPEVDIAQFLQAGAFEALLDQLVVGRALWAYGRDQGLTVSDAMVDRMIAGVPAFHNVAGQFDNEIFRRTIQQQGMNEQQVRRDVANLLMQRQLQLPIGLSVAPPEAITNQYASLLLERRRGFVGVVPVAALAQGIAPSDAEIAAFYQQNRARYTLPERRVLRYATVSRDQVAASARATDEEIAAYYQQNQARYASTETRNLLRVRLPDEPAAQRFAAAVRGGADFAATAAPLRFSASDIQLNNQSRAQLTGLTSAEAAGQVFGAAQGAVVGPVRVPDGWLVFRVQSIARAAARPLDSVRAEIRTTLESGKAEEAMNAILARIEDRIAQGNSFAEVIQAERLTVTETPPLTAAGAAPGAQWQAPAEIPALVRGAFMVDPDDSEPTIETLAPNERYALLSVARIVPSALQPLQQVRDQVRADVIAQQATARARQLADRIVARINGGVPATRAFAEAGVRLAAPEGIEASRLELGRRQGQVPPPLAALFAIPEGRARTVPAQNGIYIVSVAQRIPSQASCPAGAQATGPQANEGCVALQGARRQLVQELGGELTEQFARAAQAAVEVRRNEDAIRRARQAMQSGR
jgi:peptidyl-prolyl cis-trans isomerase D